MSSIRDVIGESPLFVATLAIAKLFTAARDAADINEAAEKYFLSADFTETVCAVRCLRLRICINHVCVRASE